MWRTLRDLLGIEPKQTDEGRSEERSIEDCLSASGRVPYRTFLRLVEDHNQASFESFVACPVLVGSSVRAGSVISREQLNSRSVRKKTFLFRPAQFLEEQEVDSDSLHQALYPLRKSSGSNTAAPNVFFLGREPGNDLIMPDFAVSTQHAKIEIIGRKYYISDLGSTNGTKLNGTEVSENRRELRDNDIVTIARYEFTVLSPVLLHRLLRTKSS